MSARTSVIGVLISSVGSALLLAGCDDATVVDRQAVEYRAAQDTHHLGCYVTTFTSHGSVAFVAKTLRLQQDGFDSCADARTIGAALAGQLP